MKYLVLISSSFPLALNAAKLLEISLIRLGIMVDISPPLQASFIVLTFITVQLSYGRISKSKYNPGLLPLYNIPLPFPLHFGSFDIPNLGVIPTSTFPITPLLSDVLDTKKMNTEASQSVCYLMVVVVVRWFLACKPKESHN